MGIAVIIFVIIIVWASDRGLDLTDESLYLLHFTHPENFKISELSFHLIQNSIFYFVNCTIQNLRIERLILSIFGSVLFAYCASFYFKNLPHGLKMREISFPFYILIISGGFLSYACGPQTISYNTFSCVFIVAASSLFLIDLSIEQNKTLTILIYIIIGYLCGILFLVKFPNAIILPAVFIVFYFIYNLSKPVPRLSIIVRTLARLLLIAVGYLLFHFSFWKGIQPMIQFHKDFIAYISQFNGYDKTTLLNIYSSSFKDVYNSIFTLKFAAIIFSLIGILWAMVKKNNKLFYIFLLFQLIIIVKFKMYYGGEANKTEQTIVYLLWALTLIMLLLIQNILNKSLKTEYFKKRLLFALFLLFMPIVGSIGTHNLLQIQIIFYMPFYMLLIYLIVENDTNSSIKKSIYLIIILLALAQSADAVIYHPYRIRGSLFTQNQKISIGKNDVVLVDEKYKENILTIEALLINNGFKCNDYLFTYTDAVGLAYIFNHPVPTIGSGWFSPNNEDGNCKTLELFNNSTNKVRVFFILDNRYPFSKSFKECLVHLGYDIDNKYNKVGELLVDFSNDPHYISIYTPR